MADAYDRVADVIGKRMDEAWRGIISDLAKADVSTLSSGGANITTSELQEFFANLGGCQMGIRFASIKPKGESVWCNAEQITPETGIAAMGINGTISVGCTINF